MTTSDINLTPTAACFQIESPKSASKVVSGAPYKLHARSWGTPAECNSAVLLVHGLGAHSGWFEALARRLKVRQIFVVSYDQVGFGKRRLEHFSSKEQWLEDLQSAFQYLKQTVADKPIYIVGNSMGALVSLAAAKIVSPNGVVMMSPGFEGHPETFTLGYRLSTLIKAIMKPEQEFLLPYGLDLISDQEGVRAWMANDPDKRLAVPGRMLLELLGLTQSLKFQKLTLTCPMLMFTAGKDKMVDNKVNQEFYKKIEAPKKNQINFAESLHDLPMNPVVDEVAEEIAGWIAVNTPRRATSV
jgi:alpha-beta hydrolase superfamily lysophospholipase